MTSIFPNQFSLIMPEIFSTISVMVLLVYGVFYSTSKSKNYPIMSRNISYLTILVLFLEFLIVLNHNFPNQIVFNGTLIIDDFSLLIKSIILLAALTTLFISIEYLKLSKINSFEYAIMILLSTIGMTVLVSSHDLITFYLAIELQSLALYVLAAFKRNSEFSTESGLKYFVLGAFSSGILLFGASLIYGFSGTTDFQDLAILFNSGFHNSNMINHGALIGLILVMVGLLFKIYAVPFHFWVPDVYEGAPTIVTAFFATVPTLSVMAIFIRLLISTFNDFVEGWQQILIICSIASMILASLAALSQRKIKRLIAYSSIGHAGYILIGFSSATLEGIQGMLLYSVIYIIMNITIFSILLSARNNSNQEQIKYLTDLKILFKTNPLMAITFALALFSLAGVPPLAGFFSKLYVFFSGIQSSLYFVVLIGIITSVIGAVYYLRLIQIMYFEKAENYLTFTQMDSIKATVLSISILFLILFFVYPSPLIILINKATLSLYL